MNESLGRDECLEYLVATDLNGDGTPDIIALSRNESPPWSVGNAFAFQWRVGDPLSGSSIREIARRIR
jgi:hypothetical protein